MRNLLNFSCFLDFGDYGKVNKKKVAKMKNNITAMNTLMRLTQDARKRYYIEGLPDTVRQRVVIDSLLWGGGVGFFEKDGEILALPAAIADGLNIYGDVTAMWVYSYNGLINEKIPVAIQGANDARVLAKGYSSISEKPTGVFVRENSDIYPFFCQVIEYAGKIADAMRTIEVATIQLKTPYIITAEETLKSSVERFLTEVNNNEQYIISTGIFPADRISVIDLPAVGENLTKAIEVVEWYENKFKALCGIDNNEQINKKGENLIQAELDINTEYTDSNIDIVLKTIQEGLDVANELWGLNMVVKTNRIEDSANFDMEDEDYEDLRGNSGLDNPDTDN